MRKNNIKLTEGMLRNVVKESIINILNEQNQQQSPFWQTGWGDQDAYNMAMNQANDEQTNGSDFMEQQRTQIANVIESLTQYGQRMKSPPLIKYFQTNIFPYLQKAQNALRVVGQNVQDYSQENAFGQNQGQQNAGWKIAANNAQALQDTGWGNQEQQNQQQSPFWQTGWGDRDAYNLAMSQAGDNGEDWSNEQNW